MEQLGSGRFPAARDVAILAGRRRARGHSGGAVIALVWPASLRVNLSSTSQASLLVMTDALGKGMPVTVPRAPEYVSASLVLLLFSQSPRPSALEAAPELRTKTPLFQLFLFF